MTVTVTPAVFQMVFFDAGDITSVVEALLVRLEKTDLELAIEVDESTPLTRVDAHRRSDGVVEVHAMSGAFEDTRRPRHFSALACETAVGRVLLRLVDRNEGFAAAPADRDLSLAQAAAWDTYCVARLARLGLPANQQRWRYNFRNRHGFTDIADDVFDAIWMAEGLTWSDLDAMSATALAARPAA
jgi:hypothetical protein